MSNQTLYIILFGVALGVGLWVVVFGLVRPPHLLSRKELQKRFSVALDPLKVARERGYDVTALRLLATVLVGLLFGFLTDWVAAGVLGSLLTWFGPQIVKFIKLRRESIARLEGIALWAEQLRHLVRAGGSVSGSILLSVPYSPEPIRPLVQKLAEDIVAFGMPEALKRFAIRADSPYADRLSLGLKIADESGAGLSDMLDELASALRDSVEVRFRTETTQTRTLLNGAAIMGITLLLGIVITILTPEYFDEYYGLVGQSVLLGVVLLYGAAIYIILQIDKTKEDPRLLEHLEASEPIAPLY